jgi:hypothetical protein
LHTIAFVCPECGTRVTIESERHLIMPPLVCELDHPPVETEQAIVETEQC